MIEEKENELVSMGDGSKIRINVNADPLFLLILDVLITR